MGRPHQPQRNHHQVELHAQTGSTETSLLNHTDKVLVTRTDRTLDDSANFPEIKAAESVMSQLKSGIQAQITTAERQIAEAREAIETQQSLFDSKRAEHERIRTAAIEQQRSMEEQLKTLESLAKEKESLDAEIEGLTIEVSSRTGAQAELDKKMLHLKAEVTNYRAILERAAAKVEGMSGQLLRASVQTESIPTEYLAAFADTCDNVRIQNYDTRCKDMLHDLLKADGIGWDEVIKTFFDLFHTKTSTGAKRPNEQEMDDLNRIFGQLTQAQYQGIYTRIDSARIARLIGAVATDHISFSYSDRGTFIDFAQASPGQQAGALLTLLLNQEAGTLIIDQPEDDLDNRIIMEIVAQMRYAKTKRQLIISTHNANVVVNGDADKIVALRPASVTERPANPQNIKISIDVDGAIETKKVKTAITSTLEGGERAFELRRRKYTN